MTSLSRHKAEVPPKRVKNTSTAYYAEIVNSADELSAPLIFTGFDHNADINRREQIASALEAESENVRVTVLRGRMLKKYGGLALQPTGTGLLFADTGEYKKPAILRYLDAGKLFIQRSRSVQKEMDNLPEPARDVIIAE